MAFLLLMLSWRMVQKSDSVMSRKFSGMRPQGLIRPGSYKFRMSATARRRSEFQERNQFFVRELNEASIRITNECC